jgi:predicted nucleic acid-binding protein
VSPALYLIDTSGLFRVLQQQHREVWMDQMTAGVIATCPLVELEFLYSARSRADRTEKRRTLEAVFGWVPMSDGAWERADEVQKALTERGQHRSVGPVDLLIAATAEHQRLILLTDDKDFELVSSVTGQPVRRVVDAPSSSGAEPRWPARTEDDEDEDDS